MKKGDKILVTGGAGFIGSNLVESLLKGGYRIIVIDNFSTGRKENLQDFLGDIQLVTSDLENYDLAQHKDISAVVHLAAQPSVPLSIENFKDSSISNMTAAINVIDYCKNNSLPLVYASSSAIYGELPFGSDESDKVDLLSPYAADKVLLEIYSNIAFKLYKMRSIGLRFFNVYGPKQDPGSAYSGVISIFVDRLLKKNKVYVNGGYQTRDFVYIDDVVRVIELALVKVSNDSLCDQVNVLTGKSMSINQLLEILSDELSIVPQVIKQNLPEGDPEKSEGSSNKLCSLLDFNLESLVDIKDGLRCTIEYIKETEM